MPPISGVLPDLPPMPRPKLGHRSHSHSGVPVHDLFKQCDRRPLEVIFKPRSVAVVGASERPGSVGRTILWNLLSSIFGGTLYPINPKRKSVLGIRAYKSIADVPEQVDLAVIVVPAASVPKVMQECADEGVAGVIIISAGFKEIGPEGVALEQEVLRIAKAASIRIVGPNCLGVMNPITGLNATFAKGMAKSGNIGFISQSGAMCTAILDWSTKEGVGFSAFVSIGSMLDVGWGDLIYYLGDDINTKAIVIYMETIGDARSFCSAAREVAMTKPIIVIKPGKTDAAAAAAASHTGSMTGSDDVLDEAFRRCGVLRVDSIEELFDMAELLGKQPPPRGPKLTIITNAGGPGVLSTDALLGSGGKLTPLSKDMMEKLDSILPAHWSHGNPIDILGDATPETYAKCVEIAAQDTESDGLLVVLSPQSMTDPTKTAESLAKASRRLVPNKPLLTSWMGGADVADGTDILNKAGIPTYSYPDTAARTFSFMWKYARNLKELYEIPRWGAEMYPDRNRCQEVISHVRETGRTILTEWESKVVLGSYGIPTVKTVLATSADEAATLAVKIGFPVAVKINSETITHKSDVGGVRLNLHTAEEVRAAYDAIKQSVEAKYSPEDFLGVTVQQMLDLGEGYELILGSSPDVQFGPVMLFGSGGTLVEVYKDRALALPPLNSNLAHRMMKSTKVYTALKGVRGREPVSIPELEALMVDFSHLIVEQEWIKELDINPLFASSDALVALDARVILHDKSTDIVQTAMRPYPSKYEQAWKTQKGLDVGIRPIMPEDEPSIQDFHKKLSEETIYKRFFADLQYTQRVDHDRLIRVCHVDYDRDMALVVTLQPAPISRRMTVGSPSKVPPLGDHQEEIIAAARLTKMHGQNKAEFSMIVADRYQKQGIGTKLLQELVRIGKDDGLDAIDAVILPINRGMIRVSEKVGFVTHYDKDEELVKARMLLNVDVVHTNTI